MAEAQITIEKVFTATGNGKKGPWTRYDVKAADGTRYQTFLDGLGKKAQNAEGAEATVTFHEETRGDFTNNVIDDLKVTSAPAPKNEKQRSKEEVRRTEAFKIAAAVGAEDLEQLVALGDAIAAELAGESAVPEASERH